MKRLFYRSSPFLASLIAGLLFYFLGLELGGGLEALFHDISAAFFAIPFLYLFYELAKDFSNRKLNKEIHDYLKMQVDREVLSTINQLTKTVYGYSDRDSSFKGISNFLNLKEEELRSRVKDQELLV